MTQEQISSASSEETALELRKTNLMHERQQMLLVPMFEGSGHTNLSLTIGFPLE